MTLQSCTACQATVAELELALSSFNHSTGSVSEAVDAQMTVEALKLKLATHCGTPAADMRLQLRAPSGAPAAALCDDRRMLGYYSPQDGCAWGARARAPHVAAHKERSSAHPPAVPCQELSCACMC
jgi:hypothetical protein